MRRILFLDLSPSKNDFDKLRRILFLNLSPSKNDFDKLKIKRNYIETSLFHMKIRFKISFDGETVINETVVLERKLKLVIILMRSRL